MVFKGKSPESSSEFWVPSPYPLKPELLVFIYVVGSCQSICLKEEFCGNEKNIKINFFLSLHMRQLRPRGGAFGSAGSHRGGVCKARTQGMQIQRAWLCFFSMRMAASTVSWLLPRSSWDGFCTFCKRMWTSHWFCIFKWCSVSLSFSANSGESGPCPPEPCPGTSLWWK